MPSYSTQASAATIPRQLPPGLGSKEAPRKPSARGPAGCGAHVPLAVPGEVVAATFENRGSL